MKLNHKTMSSILKCCLENGTPWTRLHHIIVVHQDYVKKRANIDKDVNTKTPFRCTACSLCVGTKKELIKHQKSCLDKALIGCGLCSPRLAKGYVDGGGLLSHFITHHRFHICGFPCPKELCDSVKTSPAELSAHLKGKHSVESHKARTLVNAISLERFPATIDGEKTIQRVPTYICPCGEIDFSGPSGKGKQHVKNYERHLTRCKVAIRQKVKPVAKECPFCQKKYKTSDALAHHKRKCKKKPRPPKDEEIITRKRRKETSKDTEELKDERPMTSMESFFAPYFSSTSE